MILMWHSLGGIRKCVTTSWKCLTMCSTILMLLLSLAMFIVGVKMWITINGHFGIAANVDDVICVSCVQFIAYSTIILVIASAISILILCCCFAAKLHKFNFGLVIAILYTLAGLIAIILVITTPIWFSRESNVLQRFEDSSSSSKCLMQTLVRHGTIIRTNLVVVEWKITRIITNTLDVTIPSPPHVAILLL